MTELKNIESLNKEDFWNFKRQGVKTEDILPSSLSKNEQCMFKKEWAQKIEERSYLEFDQLYSGVIEVLNWLNSKHDLFLVTLRNNRKNLDWEISHFNLKELFEDIISGKGPKYRLIQDYLSNSIFDDCWIIGDTEEEINSGKNLMIPIISVSYGIRSSTFLKKYDPDFCIDHLNEIFKII